MERQQFCAAANARLWRSIGDLILAFDAVERSSAGGFNAIPATVADEAFSAFDRLEREFTQLVSEVPPSVAEALGRELQGAILPFVRMTRTASRFYVKPLGYAGDYLTIAQIYENRPSGEAPLGELVDACFLSQPAAIAVRNRRELLCDLIQKLVTRRAGHRVRVASLACGPACEVFDVYRDIDAPGHIETTLIDIDKAAIASVNEKIASMKLAHLVRCVSTNLALVAIGRIPLGLNNQDLIYSIGLIDYFEDDVVVGLLNAIHGALAIGGSVIVGNFHPSNPNKAFMDHVLEWRLIHRNEEDMRRLFCASSFCRAPSRIFYEGQGINMFAECYRED